MVELELNDVYYSILINFCSIEAIAMRIHYYYMQNDKYIKKLMKKTGDIEYDINTCLKAAKLLFTLKPQLEKYAKIKTKTETV